jgi:hypothetical protein
VQESASVEGTVEVEEGAQADVDAQSEAVSQGGDDATVWWIKHCDRS